MSEEPTRKFKNYDERVIHVPTGLHGVTSSAALVDLPGGGEGREYYVIFDAFQPAKSIGQGLWVYESNLKLESETN